MTAEAQTSEGLIRDASRRFGEAGLDTPRLDARLLFRHASGWTAEDLILRDSEPVSDEVAREFETLIQRRLAREPVSLIIGKCEFMGLEFRTDARALAPRQDSERLVEQALLLTDGKGAGKILDLGTGSGCLLLSFLAHRSGWKGVGLDLSPDALSLAKENTTALQLENRVSFIHGSWEAALDEMRAADIILSNPPYIRTDVVETLEPEVREHDPRLALDGGVSGLEAYRAIIALAAHYMQDDAILLFEIGYDQAEDVSELASKAEFASINVFQDYSGADRVVQLAKK